MSSFGIEIELLIKPKPHMLEVVAQHGYAVANIPRINMIALHKTLVEQCWLWRLPIELYNEDSDYKEKWQVAADASIMAKDGFCECFGYFPLSLSRHLNSDRGYH